MARMCQSESCKLAEGLPKVYSKNSNIAIGYYMLNIYHCCWPVSTTSHYLPDLPFRGERRTRLGLAPRLRHAGHAETCPAAPINVNAIELQSMKTAYLDILIILTY